MKTQTKIALIILCAAGILFAASAMIHPVVAQGQSASLHELLENLRDNNTTATVEFAKALVTGELTWSLPDTAIGRTIGEVGDDYVCFSEPWNDTTRQRCTPFSNIIGVSFIR